MTRLASIAKAGFYPTPPRVLEWIARYVSPGQETARLADPCCGEGVAAEYLARTWQLESHGIEVRRTTARLIA